jgi:hypothetical protein
MAEEPKASGSRAKVAALGDLARCESLAQRASWAARYSARFAFADAAQTTASTTAGNPTRAIATLLPNRDLRRSYRRL